MSVEAIAIALHHSRAKGTAKLVLLGIANHDGDGGSWPSVGTLGIYAGVSDRNVQLGVDRLEQLGEVERRTQQGGTRDMMPWDRPNLYLFTLKCPPNCDRTRAHRMLCTECGKPLPKPRRLLETHTDCEGVTIPTPGDDSITPPVTHPTPKPSFNQLPTDIEEPHVGNRAREAGEPTKAERLAALPCREVASGRHLFDKRTGWCLRCGEARA